MKLNAAETQLNNEIGWLKKVQENVRRSGTTGHHDNLLEGHLAVCKELLVYMPAEKKQEIGSGQSIGLVRDVIGESSNQENSSTI